MRYEQGLLVEFFQLIVILGGGFGMDGAVWERVLGQKSVLGGQVFVGGRDPPFVGEIAEVVELVHGEVVATVELEVESKMRLS